jgi:galactosamine-6-phosphate isomerase
MNITYCSDYREMSRVAASLVLDEIASTPDLLLCVATGSSPEGLYSDLAEEGGRSPAMFSRLRVLKLDEWGGIPENDPASCEQFLRIRLMEPLNIPADRYISFSSDPKNPEEECARIRSLVMSEGPIGLSILGLGKNGHLGLNEPAPRLELFAHVASLTRESLRHAMIGSVKHKPAYGLTLGMGEILSSRKIIMLVTGQGKKEVAGKLLEEKVSTGLPASFLWLHPNVECLIDRGVLE